MEHISSRQNRHRRGGSQKHRIYGFRHIMLSFAQIGAIWSSGTLAITIPSGASITGDNEWNTHLFAKGGVPVIPILRDVSTGMNLRLPIGKQVFCNGHPAAVVQPDRCVSHGAYEFL